jgi:3-methyladenine DNA glycosylase AlkD
LQRAERATTHPLSAFAKATADKLTHDPHARGSLDDTPMTADEAIHWLKAHGSKAGREGMRRYAIPNDRAFGVPMNQIQKLAKEAGRDHALAEALWTSGWYEARILTAFVAEPERLTAAQMERWCRDFDNWAVVDTLCFALFDRSPHAWKKVAPWTRSRKEYVRRAGLALLWALALHDKTAPDSRFLAGLKLVEQCANDDRHYVRKAMAMALRAIGRRNRALSAAADATARNVAASRKARA